MNKRGWCNGYHCCLPSSRSGVQFPGHAIFIWKLFWVPFVAKNKPDAGLEPATSKLRACPSTELIGHFIAQLVTRSQQHFSLSDMPKISGMVPGVQETLNFSENVCSCSSIWWAKSQTLEPHRNNTWDSTEGCCPKLLIWFLKLTKPQIWWVFMFFWWYCVSKVADLQNVNCWFSWNVCTPWEENSYFYADHVPVNQNSQCLHQ